MSAAVHDALKWTRITVMNWKHAAMIMTCVEAVLRNVPESPLLIVDNGSGLRT